VRTETFVIVCVIFGVSIAVSACSIGNLASQRSSSQPSGSPTVQVGVEPSPSPNGSVRAIDFANFAYPAKPVFSSGMKTLQLKGGKYEGDKTHDPVILASIAYGDVTDDGVEEALVVLGISVRGTAIPHVVYIYTAESGSPRLLWVFETGDRGDGGLRQASAENGRLVIELYGKDKLVGKNLYKSDPFALEPACCPKFFTRARYRWQGDHFQQEGKEELLPNPEGHGSLVMTRYHPS
jgi:hypothetical protein